MPVVQSWMTTPLHFVDEIFARQNDQRANLSVVSQTATSFSRISDFFKEKFLPEKWSNIPSLNDIPAELLYNGQVVRFRGMIQVIDSISSQIISI